MAGTLVNTVVENVSAAQALERLDAPVSLFVTDVRTAGAMNRLASVNEVVRLRPDVAAVVVSAWVIPAMGDPRTASGSSDARPESRILAAVHAAVAAKTRGNGIR